MAPECPGFMCTQPFGAFCPDELGSCVNPWEGVVQAPNLSQMLPAKVFWPNRF